MLKKIIFILFLLSFLLNFSFAQNYYADIKINVDNSGLVLINGNTNYEDFLNISTNKFTSKQADNWILNITTNEIFDYYIFELEMPENTVISYIKTTQNVRFDTSNNKFLIIGTGNNKNFELIIQYQLKKDVNYQRGSSFFIFSVFFLILTFILALSFLIYLRRLNKINSNLNQIPNDFKEEKLKVIENNEKILEKYSFLPQRQKDIIKILQTRDSISQKELEKILKIPKSSISRNINSLEARKLIEKKQSGNTNFLFLKK